MRLPAAPRPPAAKGWIDQNLRRSKQNPLEISLQRVFGPSGAIRTLGPVNPNHVRYQLRYTRIFNLLHDSTRGKKNQAITAIKCSNIFDDFFLYLEYNTATTSKALEEFSLEKAERRH